MEFRPCIDIHNGKVKQIVGSSLADEGDRAVENLDRKSTRLNSSHGAKSRMPSSA